MATENSSQQSSLKQFLASIATIKGDLSNITAPPFVLADKSTTEFPRYWIEHPDLFCAPAKEQDPAKRMLAVLKWFLASHRSQQFAGRDPSDGVKKPLNAYLGELFICEIGPEGDETRLVSEQVSHHPPVTACYLWNAKHGVRAEGYTRQEITFSGSVNVQQTGHAVLHLDELGEDYLIPLPNVKVKGILTGGPYPELSGTYKLVSSAGYVAEVDFSGKGMFGVGGSKNHVHAVVYEAADEARSPLFTAEGTWTESLTFYDARGGEIDHYDVATAPTSECRTAPIDEQDPWESRKAWQGVIEAIHSGNMQGVSDHKSELEKAQREMRRQPATSEEAWESLFFRKEQSSPVAEKLMEVVGDKLDLQGTCGIWKFDVNRAASMEKPWRIGLTPFGKST